MNSSVEKDQINKNEIAFTPRRSLRIRHDLSIKKGVTSDDTIVPTSVRRSRLVRQPPLDFEEAADAQDEPSQSATQSVSNEHSSGEKGKKNQKKRNKKSKKQKAKANQKRKHAKENSSGSVHSESNMSLHEAKQEEEEEFQEVLSQTKTEPEEAALELASDSSKTDENNKSLNEIKDKETSSEHEIKDVVSSLGDQTKSEPEEFVSDTTKPDSIEDKGDGTFDLSESEIPVEAVQNLIAVQSNTTIPTPEPALISSRTKALKHGAPRFSSTPTRNSILDRTITPLKPPQSNSIKKSLLTSDTGIATPSKNPVISAPLKSALRSRRSQSLDPDDLNTTSKKNRVVFNSPSNTTINIEEVDFLMKSKKKLIVGVDSPGLSETNVTVRRKRSLSMIETNSEKAWSINKQENDEIPTKKAKHDATPNSRVKLPNFTAIHQQSFAKMESIVDHVTRKAERAKVLSTSKSKPQPGIAESVGKSKESEALFKDLGVKPLKTIAIVEPRISKARQKIELSNIKVIQKVPPSINKTIATSKATTKKVTTATESIKNKSVIVPPVRKIDEKMADRHKKHLSLYKNNTTSTNTSTLQDRRDERKEFIVGVRSNRRFVLQMQHRDRLK